jgi:prepilin-type N-terminal cleavage/methylation domain-containing protein
MGRRYKAFTLIELIIVVAIIGILATVVMISLSAAQAKARDGRRKADVVNAKKVVDLFYSEKNRYPYCSSAHNGSECAFSNTTGTEAFYGGSTKGGIYSTNGDAAWLANYFTGGFPIDPKLKKDGASVYLSYGDGDQTYAFGVSLETNDGGTLTNNTIPSDFNTNFGVQYYHCVSSSNAANQYTYAGGYHTKCQF